MAASTSSTYSLLMWEPQREGSLFSKILTYINPRVGSHWNNLGHVHIREPVTVAHVTESSDGADVAK